MVISLAIASTVGTSLVAGAVLGARHAVEADHLAAVATMVDADRRGSLMGLWWALGHMIPIGAGGVAAVALGVVIPRWVASLAEMGVGLMLIGLGVIGILSQVGSRQLLRERALTGRDSFAVGVVHGLAGSGAMILVLTTTAGDPPLAALFLAGVGLGSITTMVLLAGAWGRLRRRAAALQTVAALASGGLGVAILLELI
jgi:hypothetical protein